MRIQTSFLGTLILATLMLAPLSARAEDVSTTGKGIVGGGLLGAEIVLATEAAFKVQPGWAYLVGGVGGAAAGSVGGYFIEKDASPKTTMVMLAGGMALNHPNDGCSLERHRIRASRELHAGSSPRRRAGRGTAATEWRADSSTRAGDYFTFWK